MLGLEDIKNLRFFWKRSKYIEKITHVRSRRHKQPLIVLEIDHLVGIFFNYKLI